MSAPKNIQKRKNLETLFIGVKHSICNEQKDAKKLTLFRNGVN